MPRQLPRAQRAQGRRDSRVVLQLEAKNAEIQRKLVIEKREKREVMYRRKAIEAKQKTTAATPQRGCTPPRSLVGTSSAFSGDDMLAAATGAHRDGANLRVDISIYLTHARSRCQRYTASR